MVLKRAQPHKPRSSRSRLCRCEDERRSLPNTGGSSGDAFHGGCKPGVLPEIERYSALPVLTVCSPTLAPGRRRRRRRERRLMAFLDAASEELRLPVGEALADGCVCFPAGCACDFAALCGWLREGCSARPSEREASPGRNDPSLRPEDESRPCCRKEGRAPPDKLPCERPCKSVSHTSPPRTNALAMTSTALRGLSWCSRLSVCTSRSWRGSNFTGRRPSKNHAIAPPTMSTSRTTKPISQASTIQSHLVISCV